jgi:hypothetical protein
MKKRESDKFLKKVIPFLDNQNWYKNVKDMFPSFTLTAAFIGRDHKKAESVTITGYVEHPTETEINKETGKEQPKRYILDFFLRTAEGNYPEIFDNYWKDWKQIFEAKLNMGRAKDLNDLIYFIPFKNDKYKFKNKGFRYFTFTENLEEVNTITKKEAWHKERFPTVPFQVVQDMIDNRAEGMFSEAGVTLWEGASEGTDYHEAYHIVEETMLTPEQRDSIDKATQKVYPDLKTVEERKEQRAEDLREYILVGENPYKKGALATFFDKLYNIIKGLFGQDTTSITEVFENIKANKLSRYKKPTVFKGRLYSEYIKSGRVTEVYPSTIKTINGEYKTSFISRLSKVENGDTKIPYSKLDSLTDSEYENLPEGIQVYREEIYGDGIPTNLYAFLEKLSEEEVGIIYSYANDSMGDGSNSIQEYAKYLLEVNKTFKDTAQLELYPKKVAQKSSSRIVIEEDGERIELSEADSQEILSSMTGYLLNAMFTFNDKAFFNEELTPGDAYQTVNEWMQYDMRQELEEKYAEVEGAENLDVVKNFYTIFNNWESIVSTHTNYMKHNYGIEAADELEGGENNEDDTTKDYAFLKESYTFSTNDRLPNEIKMVIASLYRPERGAIYGTKMAVDAAEVHNLLMNNIHGSFLWSDIEAKVKKLAIIRPELEEFLVKIEKMGEEAKTKAVQHFSQSKSAFYIGLVDKLEDWSTWEEGSATEEYRILDANRNKLSSKIRSVWESNLKNRLSSQDEQIKKLTDEDKQEISRLIALIDQFKGRDQIPKYVDRLLNIFGIYTKDNSIYNLEEVYSKEGKEDTGILNILGAIIEYSDQDNMQNFFSRTTRGVGGQIDYLIEKNIERSQEEVELQHFKIGGTAVYDIGLNTYFNHQVGRWNKDNLQDFVQFRDIYSRNSVVKRLIEAGEEFETFYHEGVSAKNFSIESVALDKMSTDDRLTKLILDTLKGKFAFVRAADRKGESGFGFKSGRLLYNTPGEGYRAFKGYLIDEINFSKDRKNQPIAYVQKNSKHFGFFQDILSLNNLKKAIKLDDAMASSDPEIAYKIVNDNQKIVNEAIKDYFKNLVVELRSKLDQNSFTRELTDENLTLFLLNSIGFNIETSKILTGNPAYYKNVTDFFKRMSLYNSTKKVSRTDDAEFEVYLNKKYPRIDKKTEGRNIMKTLTVADIIVSLDEKDLKIMGELFRANASAEDAEKMLDVYKNINEADAQGWVTMDEYRDILVRAGDWTTKQDVVFNKMMSGKPVSMEEIAYFPVLKTQYVGPLSDFVNQYVPSAYKHSLMPLIPLVIQGTKLENINNFMMKNQVGILQTESANKFGIMLNEEGKVHNLYGEKGSLNFENPPYQNIDYKYFGIQLDMAPKTKSDTTEATQFNKISLSNIANGGVIKNKELAQLFKEYTDLNEEITQTLTSKLEEDMGITITNGKVVIRNRDKLTSYLLDNITSRGANNNVIEEIKNLGENDSFDMLQSKQKIYDAIASLYNKNIIKKKRRGSAHPQVSSSFMEPKDSERNPRFSNFLSFYKTAVGKETIPMEVITTLPKELYALAEKLGHGSMEAGIARLNEKFLLDDKYKEMFTYVGFRIPTQSMSSAEIFRVKKFISPMAGDMTIVPSAITAKAGSDFDIDKLNIYMPSLKFENGELVFDNEGTKGMFNKKLSMEKRFLTHPDNAYQLLSPVVDKGQLYSNYQRIKELQQFGSKNKKENSYSDIYGPEANIEAFEAFLSGKNGVGITALQITHNVISQLYGIKIKGTIFTNHNRSKDGTKIDFSQIKNVKKKNISELLSEFLSAYVDIAKDPYIFGINGYTEASNVIFFLIRSGADPDWVVSFINQPIIKDYIKAKRSANSVFRKTPKMSWEIQKDLFEKYSAYDTESKKWKSYYSQAAFKAMGQIENYDKATNKYSNSSDFVKWSTTRKSTLKKEIAETTEKYKKNEYSLEALNDFIQKGNTPNFKKTNSYYGDQSMLLDQFLMYEKNSKTLSDIVNNSNLDTGGVSNQSLILSNKLKGVSELSENTSVEGYKESLEGFYKPYLKIVKDANEFFEQIFLIDSPFVKDALINFARENSIYVENDLSSYLINLQNEFYSYLYKGVQPIKNPIFNLSKDFKTMFFGETSTAKKISEIKRDKTHPLYNNYIIQQMIPVVRNLKVGRRNQDNIKISNLKRNIYEQNRMVEGFEQIKGEDRKLYNELVKITFYQSGVTSNVSTYTPFIPFETFKKIATGPVELFNRMNNRGKRAVVKDFLQSYAIQNTNKIPSTEGKDPSVLTGVGRLDMLRSDHGDKLFLHQSTGILYPEWHGKGDSRYIGDFKVNFNFKEALSEQRGDGSNLSFYGYTIGEDVQEAIKNCE